MNYKSIEQQLVAIAAGRHDDPALVAATTSRDGLRSEVAALTENLMARRGALSDERLAAEAAVLLGEPIDHGASLTRTEIAGLESDLQIYSGALATAEQRVRELEDAASERVEAALRPLFVSLVADLDQHVAVVAATERLLECAHQVASTVLAGSNSPLAQGYGGVFAPEQTRQWWLARVRNAGLLPTERRVA